MAIITLTFAVCVTCAALAPSLIVFVVLSVPMAANSAMFTAVVQSVLQQASAPEFQGRVMSIFQIAWIGTSPIGGLVTGVVIDAASPRVAMGIGAVSALLSGAVALTVARRWAHRDARHDPETTARGDVQVAPVVPGSS
jgi:MFS family permease